VVLTDELDLLLTTPSDAGSRLSKGRQNIGKKLIFQLYENGEYFGQL